MKEDKKIFTEVNKKKILTWTATAVTVILALDDIIEHLFHLFR